jgi:hypothetical protein
MNDNPLFNLEALNLTFAGKKPGFLNTIKIHRAKVPGGWLVFFSYAQGVGGVTFYPDAHHQWDGGTEDTKGTE